LLFIMALIFPVAFYHHSWSLWLGFDFIVESLPKYNPRNQQYDFAFCAPCDYTPVEFARPQVTSTMSLLPEIR
jgi:hypothetical protein